MALNLTLPFRRASATESIAVPGAARPGAVVPLIGHLPAQQQLQILGITLAVLAVVGLLLGVWLLRATSVGAAYVQGAAQMQTLSQRIAKSAQQVLVGAPGAVTELAQSTDEFSRTLGALRSGGNVRRSTVPATGGAPAAALTKVESLWTPTQQNAQAVLKYQTALVTIGNAVKVINDRNPDLLDAAEQVVSLKIQYGAPNREVSLAGQLVMLTQRMAKNANAILAADVVEPENSFLLQRDGQTFRQTINTLLNGTDAPRVAPSRDPETQERLRELESGFKAFGDAVTDIIANLTSLLGAKQSARILVRDSAALLAATTELENAYDEQLASNRWLYGLLGLIGIAAIAVIVFLVRAFRADSERRAVDSQRLAQAAERQAAEADRLNKQNQEAILRLMNEMTAVADGDLTVRATVTEDITGAIADSVNYTIEELRALVGRINTAAEQVNTATASARDTSTQLLDAAEAQSRQIQDASSSVLRMARAINDVSASASRSVSVARQSLAAAEEGTSAVHNSIAGMNDIRAQIQETSKRIKRLGESSQQIGEIVELISDITERTQVLALNAAIQAASAGEAGRGFTVVAEEVQRLAERSTEATRQIAAIVKTIQTDTLDAVGAMERSTQGVVEGARLSDAAGQALAQIGDVSRRLAALIEEISVTAQSQAQAAGKVATGMQEILSINKQASEGTRQTAKSVADLAQVASELRASVSNFRI